MSIISGFVFFALGYIIANQNNKLKDDIPIWSDYDSEIIGKELQRLQMLAASYIPSNKIKLPLHLKIKFGKWISLDDIDDTGDGSVPTVDNLEAFDLRNRSN